jgi:methylthioribose-1-phosphate isomerase
MNGAASPVRSLSMSPLEWRGGSVRLLDQTRLPLEEVFIEITGPEEMAGAIRRLAVRGAPLLGIAAAYAVALGAVRSAARTDEGVLRDLERAAETVRASRPTAVNIAWAADRVVAAARRTLPSTAAEVRRAAADEAGLIAREDRESCAAISRHGRDLIPPRADVLTICNTGALATGGSGTALGVIAAAHQARGPLHVWVQETRPLLQGARLTAWELERLEIPMTLVADAAAGSLMARGLVDVVVVGADRIAANGDVANKVGTYPLAVLARHHDVPFYVAAPVSTIDGATSDGGSISIEERDPREVTEPFGTRVAPAGAAAANPAFDVTPAALVGAIVTDAGVARPPFGPSLRQLAVTGRAGGGRGS